MVDAHSEQKRILCSPSIQFGKNFSIPPMSAAMEIVESTIIPDNILVVAHCSNRLDGIVQLSRANVLFALLFLWCRVVILSVAVAPSAASIRVGTRTAQDYRSEAGAGFLRWAITASSPVAR